VVSGSVVVVPIVGTLVLAESSVAMPLPGALVTDPD